ncbi:2-methoxy-6-polyprenyl-1,4-benzoquinol methylase, mitochondrial [Sinobacterium norvegicum]|uniref:2-methoxy-6-polyprenyl-1,4-benzoquinol methylase, mitochondrial n=1 Tax=Sinobacterium norvegicum TaxID=1641715 RepID=A0ABN8EEH0_9GAMM|nr:class I SAM-dependent methyltransferase [Sinobacterium norvegicum]CAH0990801.1 2-methoxy-6-polyprenyl-1,4-benzoquinol methylase, mitochondrial [Sinobacterium norvegicum]
MSNDIVIEAWNTVLFEKFTRFKYLFIEGYAAISEEALKRHQYAKGASVLDVGCGFGDCTIQIAKTLRDGGSARGVDCAANFIAECNKMATEERVDNVSFFVADVEADDLGGPYDEAFARFGTMFFNFPGRAMSNIRQSLKPGGTFTQVVWRKREDNPWLYDAECCVKEIVPVISHDETDAVHCGPGPFSMAGPDMVSEMLLAVGFERIQFERFDSDICIGRNIKEAIEFALEIGPAGEIIRLAGEEGERLRPKVDEALQDVIGKYARDDGSIWAPSSAWFVTATNP